MSGVSIGPIDNASKVLSSGVVGGLYGFAHVVLIMGFSISIIYEIYKHISGQGSNYWLCVGKFAALFLFFDYAPAIISMATSRLTVSKDSVENIAKLFDTIDKSVNYKIIDKDRIERRLLQTQKDKGEITGNKDYLGQLSGKYDQKDPNKGKLDSLIDGVTNFSAGFATTMYEFQHTMFTMMLIFIIKGLIVLVSIAAYILLQVIWPIIFNLAFIGLVFAVSIAAFPGGAGAIKNWILNCVEVAAWPMVYNITISLTIEHFSKKLMSLNDLIVGSDSLNLLEMITARTDLIVSTIGYLIFLTIIIIMIPRLAHMMVRSDGAAMLGTSIAGIATSTLGAAGALALRSATSAAPATSGAGPGTASGGGEPAGGGAGGPASTSGPSIAPAAAAMSGGLSTPPAFAVAGGGGASGHVAAGLGAHPSGAGGAAPKGGRPFYNLPNVPADVSKNLNSVRSSGSDQYDAMKRAVTNLSSLGSDNPGYGEKLGQIRDWQKSALGDKYVAPKRRG